MTDVAIYQQRQSSLDLAPEAWTLATRIAGTEFVPSALRGKPEAVLAAMLTGHELGIPPMQSLAKIHVIDGRPAMAAELMRALILRAGHDIWVEESTPTRCTVVGRRAGSPRESKVTWTMDDAKRAGLDGRQNWRKYPGDMLLARATAKLARSVFADVIAGVSYSIEELTDGELVDDVPGGSVTPMEKPKGTRRRAAKPAVAAAAPAPVEEAPAAVEVLDVPLPGEDGYVGEFDEAEVVEAGTAAVSAGGGPVRGVDAGPPPGSAGGEHRQETAVDVVESPDTADSGAASPPAASRVATARAQQVAMRCRDVGIESDEHRHAFLALVTDGRATSGKDLDDTDFALVQDVIGQIAGGRLRVVHSIEGPLRIEEVGESAVANDPAWWDADQWKTHCKARGLTQAKVIRQAKRITDELGLPAPSGLGAWTDGRVSEQLLAWIDEQAAA